MLWKKGKSGVFRGHDDDDGSIRVVQVSGGGGWINITLRGGDDENPYRISSVVSTVLLCRPLLQSCHCFSVHRYV